MVSMIGESTPPPHTQTSKVRQRVGGSNAKGMCGQSSREERGVGGRVERRGFLEEVAGLTLGRMEGLPRGGGVPDPSP